MEDKTDDERSGTADVIDLVATIQVDILMACGGALALLVRPQLFDELHDAIVGGLTKGAPPE